MVETQASETKSGTVRSRRPREHLTEAEIERLVTVARQDGRYGHRDATAILVAYRHGLRSSELVDLQWDQIDFVQKTIRINRNLPVRTLETDHPCVRLLRRRMKIIHPAKPDPTIK